MAKRTRVRRAGDLTRYVKIKSMEITTPIPTTAQTPTDCLRERERARARKRGTQTRKQTHAPSLSNKFDSGLFASFDDYNQRLAAAIIFFALSDAKEGDFTARLFFDSAWFATLATGLELDVETMRDRFVRMVDQKPPTLPRGRSPKWGTSSRVPIAMSAFP